MASLQTAGPTAALRSPTLPPVDVALPYPDGCAAYELSERRCAYIVEWAREQAELGDGQDASVELLGDPDCLPPVPDRASCPIRSMEFIVRIRVTEPEGDWSDHPVFCGIGGAYTLLCTDEPRIEARSPMEGYHDVPCSGEAPEAPCASPVPSIQPAAAADAKALEVATLDIPIDHVGSYSIPVGQAVLPNGILSEAEFHLGDDTPSDLLLTHDGIRLTVESLDGGPPFQNIYLHGWRPGTERVQATLTFEVEWFEPGAVLRVTRLRVS